MNPGEALADSGSFARSWPLTRCGRRRLEQARDHPQRRRLSGAVGTEEAVDFAGLHVEAYAVDGRELAVRLDEIVDRNRHGCPRYRAHAQHVLRRGRGMASAPRSAGGAPARIGRVGREFEIEDVIFSRPMSGKMTVCFSRPPRASRT